MSLHDRQRCKYFVMVLRSVSKTGWKKLSQPQSQWADEHARVSSLIVELEHEFEDII